MLKKILNLLTENKIKKNKNLESINKTISVNVAGTTFKEDNVKLLYEHLLRTTTSFDNLSNNEIINILNEYSTQEMKTEFGNYDRIYELNKINCSYPVKLIPEPNNEYDSNAIKVVANIENKDIDLGYVPKEYNKEFLRKLTLIDEAVVLPSGGKYKYLSNSKKGAVVKTKEEKYYLELEIKLK